MTVAKLRMKAMNKSGIYPAGDRVLVFVDQIDDGLKTKMIQIPDHVKEKYQSANSSGVVVAVGPDLLAQLVGRPLRAAPEGGDIWCRFRRAIAAGGPARFRRPLPGGAI